VEDVKWGFRLLAARLPRASGSDAQREEDMRKSLKWVGKSEGGSVRACNSAMIPCSFRRMGWTPDVFWKVNCWTGIGVVGLMSDSALCGNVWYRFGSERAR
jgi:hypothetical protein